MDYEEGFGSSGGWLFIIVLFALFMKGGYGSNGVSENYTITSDFAQLNNRMNQLGDALGNGIADATFALNNTIINGNFETRNAVNGVASQIAQCCCTTQRAIDGVNYNLAQGVNTLQNTMCMNTRDIIENANANYRALHDELVANRIEDKNAIIAAQQQEINALKFTASQTEQTAYLISQLKS